MELFSGEWVQRGVGQAGSGSSGEWVQRGVGPAGSGLAKRCLSGWE